KYNKDLQKYVNCSKKFGEHLHFGVYQDVDGNDDWSADEVVDPRGWYKSITDPAVTNGYPANSWLWVFDREQQIGCGVTGCAFSDLGGEVHISVPSAYFSDDVQLSLFRGPVRSNPQSSFFNIGYSFLLRL